MGSLAGKNVLVTGASSGIGRLFAEEAARRGARVALWARRRGVLDEVAAGIRSGGGHAVTVACDVAERDEVRRALAEVTSSLGPIDVALLNAGVGKHRTLIEHDDDDAERLVRVNLLGVLYTAQPIARAMAERGEGWLVFMASIAGLVPVPGEAVYSASKFGVVGLAESLSIELEPHGVHVLTVCPGAVRTDFVPEDERDRMPDAAKRTMIEPEEVVDATLRALAKGTDRIVVPRKLEVAVAARGLFTSAVRSGTARVTRPILARAGTKPDASE